MTDNEQMTPEEYEQRKKEELERELRHDIYWICCEQETDYIYFI